MSNFKLWSLNLQALTPQKGQTHSNNLSALPMNCLSLFDLFVGLELKGLTDHIRNICNSFIKFMNCVIVKNSRYIWHHMLYHVTIVYL